MSADTDPARPAAADADAASLDLLLTDAAAGMPRRVNPGGSSLRLAAALAGRPCMTADQAASCSANWPASPFGTSQAAPSRNDRRFADPGRAVN